LVNVTGLSLTGFYQSQF